MRHEAGFTLMEMLLALFLLGLVAVFARNLLSDTAELAERQRTRLLAMEQELRLERLFRDRLARALPLRAAAGGVVRPLFEGDAVQLRFLAIDEPELGAGMPKAVALLLEEEGGITRVQLREVAVTQLAQAFTGLAAAPAVTLAELPGRWSFAYLREGDGGSQRWREESRGEVPLAVRLAGETGGPLPFLARLLYRSACSGDRPLPPCQPGTVP
ncbi:hypothetical protein HRbin40_02505 [bacterium HR40]|nr:hypothetical protein HRbin40_02505 [bacterium HR40]